MICLEEFVQNKVSGMNAVVETVVQNYTFSYYIMEKANVVFIKYGAIKIYK